MEKIKVRFLGGHLATEDNMWGGSIATTTAIQKAFENDPEYDFKMLPSGKFKTYQDIIKFIDGADIVHIDENVYLAEICQRENIHVDVIGPTMRSPVKRYWVDPAKTQLWQCPYTYDWFYAHKIIRLNYQEERDNILREEFKGINFTKYVNLIYHSVDIDRLKPVDNPERNLILWAGDMYRDAKNFALFEQITKITTLPEPYKFVVMTQYLVKDYWDKLDETAILINTSKYESFCAAMYEAQAKGVPTIYKKGMHGEKVHENSKLQVDYTAESYRDAILDLINNPKKLKELGEYNRKYTETYCSPKALRDSFDKIYKEVLNDRRYPSKGTY